MIWRARGLPGFYRGYTTVVFGTIPARMVYLSSLEMTRSAVTKTGQHLGVDTTVLAGSSNFVAGALSSLITQVITVPMDVVSQRQMVHSGGGSARSAAAGAGTGAPAAAAPSGASASSPAPAAAAAPAPGHAGVSAARGGAPEGQGHARMHTSAVQHGPSPSTQQPPTAAASPSSTGGPASHRASHRQASASAAAPSCPATSSGGSAPGSSSRSIATSARLASSAGAGSAAAGPSGSSSSALQIVRFILKEEGVLGLYRGFGASIITYVPSSAVWWGCYGLYQKLAWNMLGDGPIFSGPSAPSGPSLVAADSSSGAGGSRAGAAAAVPAAPAPAPSTLDIVLVQTIASCLAGMTSAGVTSPLDLIKTRIQVAQRQQGQAVTIRAVFAEVLREDGWTGFFRAAGPRMANSALWGTAMMSVYEALKRVSVKED